MRIRTLRSRIVRFESFTDVRFLYTVLHVRLKDELFARPIRAVFVRATLDRTKRRTTLKLATNTCLTLKLVTNYAAGFLLFSAR